MVSHILHNILKHNVCLYFELNLNTTSIVFAQLNFRHYIVSLAIMQLLSFSPTFKHSHLNSASTCMIEFHHIAVGVWSGVSCQLILHVLCLTWFFAFWWAPFCLFRVELLAAHVSWPNITIIEVLNDFLSIPHHFPIFSTFSCFISLIFLNAV